MKAICFETLAAELQHHLRFGIKRVIVTSSGPGEGKSTITARLGEALAGPGGQSVLLVDADHFKPTLHRLCGVENRRGLGELLREVYALDPRREDPGQFGLGDWVELLRAQGRTGELRVSEEPEEYMVRLDRGHIVGVRSLCPSSENRLGNLLVRQGRISVAQRDLAVRIHQQGGAPLGDVCCGLGYLEPGELGETLDAQLKYGLERLVALRSPLCSFAETAESYLAAAVGKQVERPMYRGDGARPHAGANSHAHANGAANGHTNGHDGVARTGGERTRGRGDVAQRVWKYLKRPYLSCQLPGYLKDTSTERLKVLTSGTGEYSLMDPATCQAWQLALDRLDPMFDVTLVDAPPVAYASPAERLAGCGDGVVLVVKADGLDAKIIRQAKQGLELAGAHILGVVLNQVDLRLIEPSPYYYGSYR